MEQETNFLDGDILGRYAQQITQEDGSISVRGIKNKDITYHYKKLLINTALYLALTLLVYFGGDVIFLFEISDDVAGWIYLLLFAGLVTFFVLFVVNLVRAIRYNKNSVPVSEEIRDLINQNISDNYGSFCYKNAGLFFLREWIVGTQAELDVINYKEVASYGAIGNELWIYATNSDFHLFKFMSDVECDDAYKFMQSKIEDPWVDYEDPVLKGNPRDRFKTRVYPFEPKALKRIGCANLSDWYGRKLIALLACIIGVVICALLMGKVPFFMEENSFQRQVSFIVLVILLGTGILHGIALKVIYDRAGRINEEDLKEISEGIHLPTVFFASDYNTYVFDNVILHFGKVLYVMRVEDIKIISHGAMDKGSNFGNSPNGKRRWHTPFITIVTQDTVCNIRSKLSLKGRIQGLNISDTAKELVIHIKNLPAYLKSPSATADGSTRKLKDETAKPGRSKTTDSQTKRNYPKTVKRKTTKAKSQKRKKR